MSFLDGKVLGFGLTVLTHEADTLHICSSEPADFEDVMGKSIGNKFPIMVSMPFQSDTHSGQDVEVREFEDGTVTKDGTAAAWALIDSGTSRLLASGDMRNSPKITAGNLFRLSAFTIGVPAS